MAAARLRCAVGAAAIAAIRAAAAIRLKRDVYLHFPSIQTPKTYLQNVRKEHALFVFRPVGCLKTYEFECYGFARGDIDKVCF